MHPINPEDMINLIIVISIGFVVIDLIWGKD